MAGEQLHYRLHLWPYEAIVMQHVASLQPIGDELILMRYVEHLLDASVRSVHASQHHVGGSYCESEHPRLLVIA